MNPSTPPVVAILGAGKVGELIVQHLVAAGWDRWRLLATHRRATQRQSLAARFAIPVLADNLEACRRASLLLLAVGPQDMPGLLADLRPALRNDQAVVSLAAALTLDWLRPLVPSAIALFRLMVPATLGVGLGSVLLAADRETGVDSRAPLRAQIERIAHSVSDDVRWVTDAQLELITVSANATTPYVSAMLTGLAGWMTERGIPAREAQSLLIVALRATVRQFESDGDVSAVIAHAATPGGMTHAALAALRAAGVLHGHRLGPEAMLARAKELRDSRGTAG